MSFLLNANKPIKSLQFEKLVNQSILNDAFIIEMININSFHKTKNNVRMIKRKSSNRKYMDGKNDEFQWGIYCKNAQSKESFGTLMYFEFEFFVSCKVSKSGIYFT